MRIKYIQVGILFLLFPVAVIVPVLSYGSIRLRHRAQGLHAARLLTPIFILTNALLISYIFATFTEPRYFYLHEWPISALYVLTLLGMTTARRLASSKLSTGIASLDKIIGRIIDPIFSRLCETARIALVQGTFCVAALIIDFWLLDWSPFAQIANASLFRPSFFYYFLCILGASVFALRYLAISERYRGQYRVYAWVFTLCVVAGLWYMSVYAFAYGVYPNIPVVKGGGDYATARSVEFYFNKDACLNLPERIIWRQPTADPCQSVGKEGVRSIPLKIIEETTDLIFVADPNESSPEKWRRWKTPTIYAIIRTQIAGIEYIR